MARFNYRILVLLAGPMNKAWLRRGQNGPGVLDDFFALGIDFDEEMYFRLGRDCVGLGMLKTGSRLYCGAIFLVPVILGILFSTLILTRGYAEASRPNIIYFLSDDHRADFMGCAGHPIVKTPILDKLASEGTRFENSFVTTSICAASRASILTGLYERTHKFTFGTPAIAKKFVDTSYPSVLRNNGYKTGFVGKFGVNAGKHSMFDYYKPLNRSPYFKKMPDGTKRHVTDIAGDKAIEFIQSIDFEGGENFCLSVSFNAAHAEDGDKEDHFPWPESENGLYEDIVIPAPRNSEPEIYDNHPQFLKDSLNRVRYFWRWDTPEKYQRNVKAYYRMITGLDRVIGRVLESVEEAGISDNTIIIFSGDNGYYKGARGFAGKWSHYEESLRVPLIIFDPRNINGKPSGQVVSNIALNIDIPATILDVAGVSIPGHYQGTPLTPLVHGQKPASWRTEFFCEHLMNHAQIPKWEGLRHQRFVYAHYFQNDLPGAEFLHDLAADPRQLRNLASDAAYYHILEEFRLRTQNVRDKIGGAYSIENFPTNAYLRSLEKK